MTLRPRHPQGLVSRLLTTLLLLSLVEISCRPTQPATSSGLYLHQARRLAGAQDLSLWRWRYGSGKQGGQVWQAVIDPKYCEVSVEAGEKAPQTLLRLLPNWSQGDRDFVAINGGFYDANGALGLVVSHGQIKRRFRRNGGSGVLVVGEDHIEIVHRDRFAQKAQVDHALQSIDRLVDAGRNLVVESTTKPALAARSALGLDAQGRLSLVVAFADQAVVQISDDTVYLGSDVAGQGLSLKQFAALLAKPRHKGGLGQVSALNLDGGPSTALEARFGLKRLAVVGYHGTINTVTARRLTHRAP